MGRIVDHPKVVVIGNPLNAFNITRVAITMYRHNSRGLRGDGGFNLCWIKVEGAWIDIGKYWFDTVPQ
ncbi:hypothetical protein D3C80_2100170 [compost metagenome]